jgi:hypothetical protein
MAGDVFSKDELDALINETKTAMNNEQKRNIHDTQIVLTLYGKNKHITHTSVQLFEKAEWASNHDPAREYCEKINNLVFAGDEWVNAKIVRENEISELIKPISLDILLYMDDRSVQKLMRELDDLTVVRALKGDVDRSVVDKIYKNVSKGYKRNLMDDMECMGPIRLVDVIRARNKIISIIRHLEDIGEIVISHYST